ncbi:hypothetical protein GUITHDRAFT_135513, partial [Guillardia theta CCMP2712]
HGDVLAVMDGHGAAGALVSQFVAETLKDKLLKVLQEAGPVRQDETLTEKERRTLKEKIAAAFKETDVELKAALGEFVRLDFDGSTACVVIRRGRSLITASLGDSSSVLGGRRGEVLKLSREHVPADDEERSRIERAGGMVAAFPDEPPPEVTGKGRVFVAGEMYPGLAVSRAFGDLVAKTVGVTADAEVTFTDVEDKHAVVIIASDGVWDVTTSEEAVAICLSYLDKKDAVLAAAELVEGARAQWENFQAEAIEQGSLRFCDVAKS